jgi:hypothetical protein
LVNDLSLGVLSLSLFGYGRHGDSDVFKGKSIVLTDEVVSVVDKKEHCIPLGMIDLYISHRLRLRRILHPKTINPGTGCPGCPDYP